MQSRNDIFVILLVLLFLVCHINALNNSFKEPIQEVSPYSSYLVCRMFGVDDYKKPNTIQFPGEKEVVRKYVDVLMDSPAVGPNDDFRCWHPWEIAWYKELIEENKGNVLFARKKCKDLYPDCYDGYVRKPC